MNSKNNTRLRILILVEGGKKIGFGHITRSQSLYEAFEERRLRPEFIVNGDSSAKLLLKGYRYRILDWLKDKETRIKLLKNADIIIIDSYLAREDIYLEIAKSAKVAVYLDDNDRLNYPAGIVVNGSVNTQDLGYKRNSAVKYLLGARYASLRREFWDVPDKKISKDVKSIMVTFGGDDSKGMTLKVLKLLDEIAPDLMKYIVVGRAFKNIRQLRKIKLKKTKFIFFPDAKGMKRLMVDSDLAISSGGQTLYELARVGVPTIAVAVAENQFNNIRGWEEAGFIDFSGYWKNKDLTSMIARSINKFRDKNVRLRRSLTGKLFIDGKGSRRIALELIKNLDRGRIK